MDAKIELKILIANGQLKEVFGKLLEYTKYEKN